jgi:hypothetical protein
MYVHESGVDYTLYIQNDKYANERLKDNSIFSYMAGENYAKETASSDLGDYIKKVVDSIPELKAAMETGSAGLAVFILPESTSSVVKDAVDQTTQKMLDEGTDENVLKGVLGIVKENYSFDIEFGTGTSGVSTIKNDTVNYDMEALNNVLSKFKEIYSSNTELSNGLGKFSKYVNEIYDMLQKEVNPTSDVGTTTTASSDAKNDLVDTLIQEMEKSEDNKTPGTKQLNKKLYKNYIKSLKSNLVGGLLQQSS